MTFIRLVLTVLPKLASCSADAQLTQPTSRIADLWIDPDLAQKKNAKRTRRAASFALTLIGAIIGGFISASTHSIRLALWLVGVLKVGIVVAWLFWAEEKSAF